MPRIQVMILIVAAVGSIAVLVTAVVWWRAASPGSPFSEEPAVIAQGSRLYAEHCAGCHGARLEGQPDWQSPRANGKMPAPPHNSEGHTWHHDSAMLFAITKQGLVPPWAPPNYRSDMPAFAGVLSDEEIWAVLSFIASTWNDEARTWHRLMDSQAETAR